MFFPSWSPLPRDQAVRKACTLVMIVLACGSWPASAAAASRSVAVRWMAFPGEGLKVAVALDKALAEVPLGTRKRVTFKFTNLSSKRVSFNAVHTVDPDEAAKHLSKTVCFCSVKQTLAPHETKELPVVYTVNSRLPVDISDIVVSYRLVRVK
jgi:cytochrome c oxidase assembly protein subunit 11